MILDKHGLIVTRNWKGELDGGDTLTNEFTYRIALFITNKHHNELVAILKLEDLLKLVNPDLDFVRHPDPMYQPYGDWAPGRDQMIAPIVFGSMGPFPPVGFFINTSFKARNYKYQSKDIPFIELWSLLTRMNYEKGFKAYLKCLIGDLWILGDVLNRLQILPKYRHDKEQKWKWFDPEDVDDRNTILCLIQSRLRLTTFISSLAWFLYFRFRDWKYALRHYFRAESGNNPEIAEELILAVEMLMNDQGTI